MRVLILSATTGGGHMRAANALKDYILEQDDTSVVEIYDTIQYISPLLNKAVTNGYVYMATKTPKLYGGMYKSSDKNTPLNKAVEIALVGLRNRLIPMMKEFRPDIIVTTHAFAAELICALKKKDDLHIPIVNILTDFSVHRTYINKGVDAYIMSSDEMVNQMLMRGLPREILHPFGIPVKTQFLKKIDRRAALEEEALDPELPTVLIMAGSFGVTDILKIYHKIVKSEADFQIIVITGKNEKLFETFERYLSKIDINNTLYELQQLYPSINQRAQVRHSRTIKPTKPTKLLYFTDQVEKYMQMSDLIVTKPGGLTVSEAIATGLPMAIFKAIPGQEEQNADYLVKNGMAVRLFKDKTCTDKITDLITNPDKLKKMREAIRKKSNGNSAARIYELLQKLVKEYQAKKI